MFEDDQDVTPESSSALGEAISSTPEVKQEAQESQDTETSTPQTDENQERYVPFNEHPRFKELIEERNWYRQQLERANLSRPQPQPQQIDPYFGMTPEEERYWRAVDKRAEAIVDQRIKIINPMLEAGIKEITAMKVQQFRNNHPDIKPNSPEEVSIASKISMGYSPEDAYRSVMWDTKVAKSEERSNIVKQQRMETKKQANVENRSIPQGVNSHVKEKLTLRQEIERNAKDLGF